MWQKVESLLQIHQTPKCPHLYQSNDSIKLMIQPQFAIARLGCSLTLNLPLPLGSAIPN